MIQLEDAAKSAGKGKWNTAEAAKHIRNVKWTVENARNFVDSHHNKPIDGKHGPYYSDIILILFLSSEIFAICQVQYLQLLCILNIGVMRNIDYGEIRIHLTIHYS